MHGTTPFPAASAFAFNVFNCFLKPAGDLKLAISAWKNNFLISAVF
jgi:hypothetical protein